MKRNGFVSLSLIYTFFTLFLLLMVFLLNNYSATRFLLDQYKTDIKENFIELSSADINLYIMVWNNSTNEYEFKREVPTHGYYESAYSYCENGSTLSYEAGILKVAAAGKDYCYAYFKN